MVQHDIFLFPFFLLFLFHRAALGLTVRPAKPACEAEGFCPPAGGGGAGTPRLPVGSLQVFSPGPLPPPTSPAPGPQGHSSGASSRGAGSAWGRRAPSRSAGRGKLARPRPVRLPQRGWPDRPDRSWLRTAGPPTTLAKGDTRPRPSASTQ